MTSIDRALFWIAARTGLVWLAERAMLRVLRRVWHSAPRHTLHAPFVVSGFTEGSL